MKKRKKLKRIFRNLLLVFLLATFIGLIWFYFAYGRHIIEYRDNAVRIASESSVESFKAEQTSIVYAADGSILTTLKGEKDVYYLPYEGIPTSAIDAVLVTEDKKFYSHDGVDYLANIRAAIALIKHKGEISQGASTITQQLARNVFLSNEVSLERKVTEIFLAAELEKKYTKQQILEFYFNNIYYANGYYGIQAASNGYFSKSVNKLTLSEIAFLSAIPNSPTMLDPLVHFEDTLERRDKILDQMYNDGVITEKEYKKALKQEIVLKHKKTTKHNYAESYTFYCAIRALMENEGFEFKTLFTSLEEKQQYEDAYDELYYRMQRQLYTKGYRIYTSLDMKKQKQLQQAVNEQLSAFTEVNDEGTYALQGAAVCIDNDTGRVVAIIGGRGQKTNGYTLNRAYQSYRQPGSSIKPLLVYTPMFERGTYPDTPVLDKKVEGGPRNAGNSYLGETTVRKAVEMSKNTVAWNLLKELTPSVGLSYLLKMNFSHIEAEDYNLGIAIGGFTYGVSPIEMTAAFATIENNGDYRNPTCIVQITDSEGNEIIGQDIEEKPIYQINAARMMTDVLTGVMTSGTGRNLALDHMTSAGKTGTTTDQKDGWFVGYTKYYTTGVWVGYDYPKTLAGLAGSTYPGYIWKQFMNEIHSGLEDIAFDAYIDDRNYNNSKETFKDTSDNNEEDTNEDNENTRDMEDQNSVEDIQNSMEDTQSTLADDEADNSEEEDYSDSEESQDENTGNSDSTDTENQDDNGEGSDIDGDASTDNSDTKSSKDTSNKKQTDNSSDTTDSKAENPDETGDGNGNLEDGQTEEESEENQEEESAWDEGQWMEEQFPND